ncbi:MAG: RDD family protein [cyanobacterium endosymbiont of Rhopalodia sterrenbergii]
MYSDNESAIYRRFPKVPIDRRAYAFVLDFIIIWLISSFFGFFLQELFFIICWLILRVILVEKNKGQSLGSWAFDIKVIDIQFSKTPGLIELAKREGILGGVALLAMIGLRISFRNGLSMLLLTMPLLVDCGIVLGDQELNQAFHDRIAGTILVQTNRGFSLDLRLKRLQSIIKGKIKSSRDRDKYRDD